MTLVCFLLDLVLEVCCAAVFDVGLPALTASTTPARHRVAPRADTSADLYGVSLLAGGAIGWAMTFVAPTRLLPTAPVPGMSIALAPLLAAVGGAALGWIAGAMGSRVSISRVTWSVTLFAFALAVSRWFFVLD